MALSLPPAAGADTIRVQSTTDTVDAGLVDGLLRDAYKRAQPGDTLDYTAVGTGKALDNARNGLGDVVITHAPSLEAQFVADGYSVGLGRQIFYSDYVIVGPKSDPAGVGAAHPHDAVGAFEDIDAAGNANADAVRFLSRGDNSGTNVQEQIIWGLSGVTKQPAVNAAGNTARSEPGSRGTYPAFYKKTTTGQAANANQTEACAVQGDGCYTLVDRGTFNRLVDSGTVTNLRVVSDKNGAGARGGENLLVNPFAVYLVNPAKITTDPKPNVPAANRFADFLVSAGFQAALNGFPSAVDPAFLPDAFPAVALDQPLPPTAAAGSTLAVAGTASNRLSGGGPIAGLRVQLQRSTDDGETFTDVGAPAPTSASGSFRVSASATRTARYRLSLPAHAATSYNAFSATTQALGVVSVPAGRDGKAPRISRVRLTRRRLSVRVSEGAVVRTLIQRRVGTRGLRTVAVVRIASARAATLHGRHRALNRGAYRLRITASDDTGNRRTVTRTVRRG